MSNKKPGITIIGPGGAPGKIARRAIKSGKIQARTNVRRAAPTFTGLA
jgi:hypothetical protein